MVRIPDRPDAYIMRGVPRDFGFSGGASSAAGIVAAVGEGAANLFRAALAIQETRDHDLLVEAQNRYTAGMGEFERAAEEERVADKARGFTREYGEFSGRTRDETLSWMEGAGGSKRAGTAFRQWAEGRKTAGEASAARFEHGQLLAHGRDMFEARLASIREAAERDPENFADAAKQLEESFVLAAGQGIFRPQEAKNRLAEARDALGRTAFESLYAKAPGAAARRMGEYGLSPAEQARMKKRFAADAAHARAMAAAKQAGERELLRARVPDAEALLEAGNLPPVLDLARNLRALGDERTAARLEAGAARAERLKGAYELANTLPLPELARITAAGEAELAGASDTAGAAAKGEKLELFRKVGAARAASLQKDPAGTTAARAAALMTQDRLNRSANPREEEIGLRLGIQAGDGLPEAKRRALTAAEAQRLGDAWRDAPAGDRPGIARAIAAEYGRHADKAFAEAGVDPLVTAAALRALGEDGVPRLAALPGFTALATADATPDKDLPELADKAARLKELEEGGAYASAFLEWAGGMMDIMPDNSAFAGLYTRALALAGKTLALRRGDQAFVRDALDGGLEVLKGAGFNCLYDPDEIDGEDLQRGLARVLATELAFFEEKNADEDPAEKRERVAWLLRNGRWANAPDNKGFALFDPYMQTPVVDREGNYFRRDVRQIRAAAAAASVSSSSGGVIGY